MWCGSAASTRHPRAMLSLMSLEAIVNLVGNSSLARFGHSFVRAHFRCGSLSSLVSAPQSHLDYSLTHRLHCNC